MQIAAQRRSTIDRRASPRSRRRRSSSPTRRIQPAASPTPSTCRSRRRSTRWSVRSTSQTFGAADGHRQERQDRHLLHEGSERAHAARQRRRRRRVLLRARSLPDGGHADGSFGLRGEQLRRDVLPARAGSDRRRISDARSKQDVLDVTPGTLAHEYQHLINAGRRIYVNNADDFEEVWLNEGLSHIAEELLYYQRRAASRRGRTSTSNAFGDRRRRSTRSTTTQATTSAATRSSSASRRRRRCTATTTRWRRAARPGTAALSRRSSRHADGDTWTQLVNTHDDGQHESAHVFGATYMTQIRDWATSVFTDDVTGVDRRAVPRAELEHAQHLPESVNSDEPAARHVSADGRPASDASPANVSVDRGRRGVPPLLGAGERPGVDRLVGERVCRFRR